MSTQNQERVPKKMREKYDAITAITDSFCEEHLNDEYAHLCRKLAATLSRKRPSPLERGRTKSWAAAVYAIGQINFLFDKSQTPHMRADDLCEAIGVSQSTASAKAKQIRDMLNIGLMDPNWTLLSQMDDNPMAWMIMVNGLIVDARSMPREIQEEAYRKGLIPYLPK
jgi:hypothetical protein